MRRIIGIALLAFVFFGIFFLIATLEFGIKIGAIIIAVALSIIAIIGYAIYLIET